MRNAAIGVILSTMPKKPGADEGTILEERTLPKFKRPPLYKVLLHNDDYTTREFVVYVLQAIFDHDEQTAVTIMLHVHHRGVGVAGVYTREIAETKIRTVEALSEREGFPLLLTMEPDDDDE